jgi:proline dehydrogenase
MAVRQAMRLLGQHFVLGQSIDEALSRADSAEGRMFRYSYDMLGEGARNLEDASHYRASYHAAIQAIGKAAGGKPLPDRPGISVKLSALHPRYEATAHAQVMAELCPIVLDLARAAKAHDLNFTIDAEEADRLVDMDAVVREAVERAEQAGIVFIDEIDKVSSRGAGAGSGGPDVSRVRVSCIVEVRDVKHADELQETLRTKGIRVHERVRPQSHA